MAQESPYLLTSLEGIPIIIKCESVGDKLKFKKANSVTLSLATFKRNLESGEWVQDSDDPFICKSINHHAGDYEVWIRKSDAFKSAD